MEAIWKTAGIDPAGVLSAASPRNPSTIFTLARTIAKERVEESHQEWIAKVLQRPQFPPSAAVSLRTKPRSKVPPVSCLVSNMTPTSHASVGVAANTKPPQSSSEAGPVPSLKPLSVDITREDGGNVIPAMLLSATSSQQRVTQGRRRTVRLPRPTQPVSHSSSTVPSPSIASPTPSLSYPLFMAQHQPEVAASSTLASNHQKLFSSVPHNPPSSFSSSSSSSSSSSAATPSLLRPTSAVSRSVHPTLIQKSQRPHSAIAFLRRSRQPELPEQQHHHHSLSAPSHPIPHPQSTSRPRSASLRAQPINAYVDTISPPVVNPPALLPHNTAAAASAAEASVTSSLSASPLTPRLPLPLSGPALSALHSMKTSSSSSFRPSTAPLKRHSAASVSTPAQLFATRLTSSPAAARPSQSDQRSNVSSEENAVDNHATAVTTSVGEKNALLVAPQQSPLPGRPHTAHPSRRKAGLEAANNSCDDAAASASSAGALDATASLSSMRVLVDRDGAAINENVSTTSLVATTDVRAGSQSDMDDHNQGKEVEKEEEAGENNEHANYGILSSFKRTPASIQIDSVIVVDTFRGLVARPPQPDHAFSNKDTVRCDTAVGIDNSGSQTTSSGGTDIPPSVTELQRRAYLVSSTLATGWALASAEAGAVVDMDELAANSLKRVWDTSSTSLGRGVEFAGVPRRTPFVADPSCAREARRDAGGGRVNVTRRDSRNGKEMHEEEEMRGSNGYVSHTTPRRLSVTFADDLATTASTTTLKCMDKATLSSPHNQQSSSPLSSSSSPQPDPLIPSSVLVPSQLRVPDARHSSFLSDKYAEDPLDRHTREVRKRAMLYAQTVSPDHPVEIRVATASSTSREETEAAEATGVAVPKAKSTLPRERDRCPVSASLLQQSRREETAFVAFLRQRLSDNEGKGNIYVDAPLVSRSRADAERAAAAAEVPDNQSASSLSPQQEQPHRQQRHQQQLVQQVGGLNLKPTAPQFLNPHRDSPSACHSYSGTGAGSRSFSHYSKHRGSATRKPVDPLAHMWPFNKDLAEVKETKEGEKTTSCIIITTPMSQADLKSKAVATTHGNTAKIDDSIFASKIAGNSVASRKTREKSGDLAAVVDMNSPFYGSYSEREQAVLTSRSSDPIFPLGSLQEQDDYSTTAQHLHSQMEDNAHNRQLLARLRGEQQQQLPERRVISASAFEKILRKRDTLLDVYQYLDDAAVTPQDTNTDTNDSSDSSLQRPLQSLLSPVSTAPSPLVLDSSGGRPDTARGFDASGGYKALYERLYGYRQSELDDDGLATYGDAYDPYRYYGSYTQGGVSSKH